MQNSRHNPILFADQSGHSFHPLLNRRVCEEAIHLSRIDLRSAVGRQARLFRLLAGIALFACADVASAQDRAQENAVTQAEDAFGFSVGRESVGIYTQANVRGFSPIAAGNVRIEGLYFNPIFGLQGSAIDSTSIKVGLSAQGYPFAAPSGIVDQNLRRPEKKPGMSIVLNADDFGGKGFELNGSLPLTGRLGAFVGLSGGRTVFSNGTDNLSRSETVVGRWRPTDDIELVPFWTAYDDYGDESGTLYTAGGRYIPRIDRPHHDEGPHWADNRFTGENLGLLGNASLGPNWIVRIGAFRSSLFNRHSYTFLLANEQPDGSADRILIADPPNRSRSLSGELRVIHSIPDGARLHLIQFSVRRRDSQKEFGGSDFISFGMGRVGEKIVEPMPEFEFGAQTHESVKQLTYGAAYDGRWKGVGEVSFSLSQADYRKTTATPMFPNVVSRSRPLLYNGTAALIVTNSLRLYASYARGLEESGTAPFSAANRNQPLETILTQQKDAGLRLALTDQVIASLGVFDLQRPYFGFDSSNVFKKIGSVRNRGLEFSVSGKVTPQLNILAGGVLLDPRVTAETDTSTLIGSKPFGVPTHILNFNINWKTSFSPNLQLDFGISHRGRQPATTDNLVYLPPRLNVNLGMHYTMSISHQPATLRLQITNLTNNHFVNTFGPGLFGPKESRQVLGYLTFDL